MFALDACWFGKSLNRKSLAARCAGATDAIRDKALRHMSVSSGQLVVFSGCLARRLILTSLGIVDEGKQFGQPTRDPVQNGS